jgi:hypothetical protein
MRCDKAIWLNDSIEAISQELSEAKAEYFAKKNEPYLKRFLIGDRIIRLDKLLTKREGQFKAMQTADDKAITKEMIDNAKAFPMENLIELKKGKAKCPFHDEKTASFSIKDNKYHCFGCGVSGDTISLLMERDGLNFIEAVKELQ